MVAIWHIGWQREIKCGNFNLCALVRKHVSIRLSSIRAIWIQTPHFSIAYSPTLLLPPPSESLQKLKLQRLAEYLPDLKFLTRKLRKVFAMNKKFHFLSDEEKRRTTKKWFPTVLLGSDSKLGGCGALTPPVFLFVIFFICDIIE